MFFNCLVILGPKKAISQSFSRSSLRFSSEEKNAEGRKGWSSTMMDGGVVVPRLKTAEMLMIDWNGVKTKKKLREIFLTALFRMISEVKTLFFDHLSERGEWGGKEARSLFLSLLFFSLKKEVCFLTLPYYRWWWWCTSLMTSVVFVNVNCF